MKISSQELEESIDSISDPTQRLNPIMDSQDGTITSYLYLLWQQRNKLRSFTLKGLAITTVIVFLIPSKYESATRLMPPDTQSPLAMLSAVTSKGGAGDSLGALAGDLLGAKTTGLQFIGILKSRSLLDGIVRKFDLRKVYNVSLWEQARKELSDNTDISEDRKSGIITITVTDKNPDRAAAIATAYVNELDRLVASLSTSAARRERVFLENRLGVVKQELDDASRRFSFFASKNSAIDIPQQGKAMVEAAAILQGQLIAAQSQASGLEQIYTPNNVRVRQARATIAELQRQLDKMGGAQPDAQAVNGDNENHALYPSIRELPVLGVQYFSFLRDVKIREAVFEVLTKQYELAKVQEAKEIPSVKVLDPADIPEKKSAPSRTLIIAMGAILSLLLGITWVLGGKVWASLEPNDPIRVIASVAMQKLRSSAVVQRLRNELPRHWLFRLPTAGN